MSNKAALLHTLILSHVTHSNFRWLADVLFRVYGEIPPPVMGNKWFNGGNRRGRPLPGPWCERSFIDRLWELRLSLWYPLMVSTPFSFQSLTAFLIWSFPFLDPLTRGIQMVESCPTVMRRWMSHHSTQPKGEGPDSHRPEATTILVWRCHAGLC